MEKTKRHILSTGPLPQAVREEAAAQNFSIDVVPFIETKFIINDKTAAHIRELFQKPITAVFTSSNAVHAVAQLFQKPMPWKVYSIGSSTANTITQLFQMPISGTAHYGAALADVILKDRVKEIYFFCGTMRRDELPQTLRKANIPVHEVVVYKTVETPQVITTVYDAVLFYSPSAVHSFFSANNIGNETTLFAIGNTTADAVRQHTDRSIIVAQEPDKKGLVRQVMLHFNTKKENTE